MAHKQSMLFRSVTIIDPRSEFNHQKTNILIQDGKYHSFNNEDQEYDNKVEIIECDHLYLSVGWFDMNVNFCDPGFEMNEDLVSGTAAAAHGGFTGVALMPNTEPPLHTKSQINYLKDQSRNLTVDVFPIGAVSANRNGKDMAEMFDMANHGAVAFSDGDRAIADAGLLLRSAQYAANFGKKVIVFADDLSLYGKAIVNEGEMSVVLGMKGMPALAEEMMIARDIALCEYANCPIHFTTVSTAGSVQLIRAAKQKGLPITADVSSIHVFSNENVLSDFNTNYKVKPPLRSENDRLALIAGIVDGTIDAICSQHTPQTIEHKKQEFEIAAFGISNIETSFSLLTTSLENQISIERMIELIAINPRSILNLKIPEIKIGQLANFTLFDPKEQVVYSSIDIKSKSKNNPYLGKKLLGKVHGIYNKGAFINLKN